MGSAQLDIDTPGTLAPPVEPPLPPFELTQQDLSPTALKQQLAERVAAHRARRGLVLSGAVPPSPKPRPARARIADAVAERYAHSPSYRSFLAAEAERAVDQADAAAQIATINAQAIAQAQQQLLAELEDWSPEQPAPSGPVAVPTVPLSPLDYAALFDTGRTFVSRSAERVSATPLQAFHQAPSFTVKPYQDHAHPAASSRSPRIPEAHPRSGSGHRELDEDERLALEDEIEFRHNPVFEEISPAEPIAANLIEFPRQLIAARKGRPRIAEGPLRDEEAAASPQLRIFEVETGNISSEPAAHATAPEWSSILLSALPRAEYPDADAADYLAISVPQPARLHRRVLAAGVDAALTVIAQAAFTAVFYYALTHIAGQPAVHDIPRLVAVGATLATFAVLGTLYQLLFFTLADATPGMRYARIGLCTFADTNPTRSAMRRRLFATLLAAAPLGLGLLWALLDEDTLGWHDRISRMYQRSY